MEISALNDIETVKKVHFIGIGGIGVSALARFYIARGARVTGSDVNDSEITRDLISIGARISIGNKAEYVPDDVLLVIHTSAMKEYDPEAVIARERNVPVISYFEALGSIMHRRKGVAVCGTHGKTTVTALLGELLINGEKDPLVIVGGKVPGWDQNIRIPIGVMPSPFVVEACEYRRQMLNLSPWGIVVNNIEEDHLDYYKDIDDIKSAFTEFIEKLPPNGWVAYNADDTNTASVVGRAEGSREKVSFGIDLPADLQLIEYELAGGVHKFTLVWKGQSLGYFELHIPGRNNLMNALAATAAALHLGVSPKVVAKTLEEFTGTWRRFERVGELDGALVVSDYAHHPTAVRGTIQAAKDSFPGKNILTVFRPHHRDRTTKLFTDFVEAFDEADDVMVAEIYDVPGREGGPSDVTGEQLVEAINERGKVKSIKFEAELEGLELRLRTLAKDYDVVLIMGAGDVYKVAEALPDNIKD